MFYSGLPCCSSDEQPRAFARSSMHDSYVLHMVFRVQGIRMTGKERALTAYAALHAGALCCRWSSAPGSLSCSRQGTTRRCECGTSPRRPASPRSRYVASI